jgi:stage II sporulation protein AA (anti-sigma F factor antagonist)
VTRVTNGNQTMTNGRRWVVSVSGQRTGEGLIVTIAGRVAAAEAGALGAAIEDLARGETGVVLDLKYLDYISSAGLHVLVEVARQVRGRGGILTIVNPQPAVRAVLEISGLPL